MVPEPAKPYQFWCRHCKIVTTPFGRHTMTNRRTYGFTLIELMVVVAVVAILAAIALPSYQSQMRKSRRVTAISALQDLQLRQEKWRVDHCQYATQTQLGTMPAATQYTITVTAPTAVNWTTLANPPNYELTATPTGGQAQDTCGTLKLLSASGVITKQANGAVNPSCW
jgi:type IV pilus assembly protein PilE